MCACLCNRTTQTYHSDRMLESHPSSRASHGCDGQKIALRRQLPRLGLPVNVIRHVGHRGPSPPKRDVSSTIHVSIKPRLRRPARPAPTVSGRSQPRQV
jgi:hypothetical protein